MNDVVQKISQGGSKSYRDKENIIRDAITAISVCHNVTPVIDDGKEVILLNYTFNNLGLLSK